MIKTYHKHSIEKLNVRSFSRMFFANFKRRKILLFSLITLIVILPISLIILTNKSTVEAAWMDDAWLFRKAISIPTHTTLETNVYVIVPTFDATDTTKFQADCGDLRFTKQNGEQLPYYVVDCDATANIHVLFDSLPAGASTYYMYYGNPSVANGFSSADFATAATGLGAQTLAAEEKSAGPVAYWKFDEGYGTNTNNYNNNSNTGTLNGGITWKPESDCVSGKCIYLDGVNGWVQFNGNINISGPMTISFWFKTPDKNAVQYLFDNRNPGTWWFIKNYNATVCGSYSGNICFEDRVYALDSEWNTNKWTHVEVTDDTTTSKMYIDGKLVRTGTGESTSITTNLRLGTRYTNSGYYKGYMDDVKIYSYARTAAQIKSDFATKGSGSVKGTSVSMGSNAKNNDALSNGLVSYWKSDEASGNGADSSGNANTSTVSGSNNYGAGKFGNGLRSGVATTNLVTNPSFETNTTSWVGVFSTITRITTDSKYGSASLKTDFVATSGSGTRYSLTGLAPNTTYAFSGWFKTTTANSVLTLVYDRSIGGQAGASVAIPNTGGVWSYVSKTIALDANATGTGYMDAPRNNVDTTTVYTDGIQIEQSSTVAPYVDGSLGTGYSWSGTAHASTSTRTASTATNATLLNNMTGSLSFWFNSPSLDTSAQCPLGSSDGDNTGGLFFGLKSTGVYLNHNYAVAQNVTPQYAATMNNNTWYHVVYTWDNTALKGNLYVNGALQQTVSYTQAITKGDYIQNLGTCTRTSYTTFNGTLDDIRDYNRALSGAEVRRLYAFAPGPLAYYNFEESSGNANDLSGNGYTGVSTGTTAISGKYGKARRFNGSSDVINVTDNANLRFGTGNFTVESWIKFPISGSLAWEGILTKGYTTSAPANTWGLIRNNTNTNSVKFQDSIDAGGSWNANLGSSTFSDGWHHVAVTRSGTTYSIYSDGVFTTSGTYALVNLSTTAAMKISSDASPRYFNGSLDDVKIYNYARTSGQIVEDMNAGHPLGGSPVGSQVGYWKFDEGYLTTAKDSLNNNHGTFNNSPQWNQSGKFNKAVQFSSVGNATNISLSGSGTLENVTDNNFTFSTWVNPTAIPPSGGTNYIGTIIGRPGYHTYLGYTYQQKFSLGVYNSSNSSFAATSTNTYSLNQWYHLTGVVNTTDLSIKLFVNGIQVANSNYTGTLKDYATSAYRIGASANGACTADWTWCFDGLIDEVKIYNAALTADEIKLDYNRGSAMVLGAMSDTSNLTGGSVASSSASSAYCVPGDTTSCAPPVAEWNFEEGAGTTLYDKSGNANNSTLWNGTPLWQTGKFGSSLYFDGSGTSGVEISSPSNFASPAFTAEVWVDGTNQTGNTRILNYGTNGSNYGGFIIGQNPGGTLRTYIDTTGAGGWDLLTSTGTVNNGAWHHLTLVYDGTNRFIYIDGTKDASTDVPSAYYSSPSSPIFTIGQSSIDHEEHKGKIDQVRIYNYARTPAQIAWDYNRGKPVGWWKMDECQGITANDSSGNGNSGTIASAGTIGTCTSSVGDMWKDGAIGKYNSSLDFDFTTGDNIQIADNTALRITDELSVCAWIKSDQTSASMGIFEKTIGGTVNTSYLLFSEGTVYKWRIKDSGATQTLPTLTTLTTLQNNWSHLCSTFTKTTGTAAIYVNGKLDNSSTFRTNPITTGAGISYIGALGGPIYPFSGQIDDVRIYNYALTPVQIKQVYNNGAINFGPATGGP